MSIYGQIETITLEDRNRAFIEICNIAAIIELEANGPTRLLFVGGGHLDICGSAEIWRREVAIARIKQETLA
jgi:hypothetical protein